MYEAAASGSRRNDWPSKAKRGRGRTGREWTEWMLLFPIHLLTAVVPRSIALRMAYRVGPLFYWLMPRARNLMRRNLARLSPENRVNKQDVKETFRNYARYLIHYGYLMHMPPNRLVAAFNSPRVSEGIRDSLRLGRGVIIVTPHLGHWEYGSPLLTMQGIPLTVFTGSSPDIPLEQKRMDMRARHGIRTMHLPPREAPLQSFELIMALRQGRARVMLGDSALDTRSVTVRFLGRDAPFPAGPAVLSWLTGAPIHPCRVIMGNDDRMMTTNGPRLNADRTVSREQFIQDTTQSIADHFEPWIRECPTQWFDFTETR